MSKDIAREIVAMAKIDHPSSNLELHVISCGSIVVFKIFMDIEGGRPVWVITKGGTHDAERAVFDASNVNAVIALILGRRMHTNNTYLCAYFKNGSASSGTIAEWLLGTSDSQSDPSNRSTVLEALSVLRTSP
ncbi:hypothetical protein IV203_013320 [Nitzschia inconspicua]|uniref:Uncharacterized protein n=1 Tax=Nitzschia inconspicua TaxID=303405 RepID=A0A9K3M5Q5_9STRA|nr:hypothetical protein IV203_013320 [Nitzschia inconspicua]